MDLFILERWGCSRPPWPLSSGLILLFLIGGVCGELPPRSSLCGSLSPPFLYPTVPARAPSAEFSSSVCSMVPCRGESAEGEPEDSRWSTIVHHSSSMKVKVVEVSRAKWVEVVWIECPVSPGVVEVMHLQLRANPRLYKGHNYIPCAGREETRPRQLTVLCRAARTHNQGRRERPGRRVVMADSGARIQCSRRRLGRSKG